MQPPSRILTTQWPYCGSNGVDVFPARVVVHNKWRLTHPRMLLTQWVLVQAIALQCSTTNTLHQGCFKRSQSTHEGEGIEF